MKQRTRYVVPVTIQMSRDQYKHLHDKVVREIRQGEEGPERASVTKMIRQLIEADMGKVDA